MFFICLGKKSVKLLTQRHMSLNGFFLLMYFKLQWHPTLSTLLEYIHRELGAFEQCTITHLLFVPFMWDPKKFALQNNCSLFSTYIWNNIFKRKLVASTNSLVLCFIFWVERWWTNLQWCLYCFCFLPNFTVKSSKNTLTFDFDDVFW